MTYVQLVMHNCVIIDGAEGVHERCQAVGLGDTVCQSAMQYGEDGMTKHTHPIPTHPGRPRSGGVMVQEW